MRICIDISQIVYGTGVSVYTRKLVENLQEIDREDSYVLFGGSLRRMGEISGQFPKSKVLPIPPTLADIVWNRLHILPIEKLVGNIDVFHSSDWSQPPSRAFKVTTVHDLIPLKFPKMVHKNIVQAHLRRLIWVKREVDRVIVPSESTKTDLIDFGVSESRIRVIPEAPGFGRANEAEIAKVRSEYNLSGDYLLAFASGPYKNAERIVRAFELAGAGENLKLVLVGRQSVEQVKNSRNIRLTGFLPTAKVQALLSGASALVFASLYEGYGQTILEGFACGVPVVTSNVASMPEVAGNAAVLVDPESVDSIAEGIRKAIAGPKGLIEKGNERVKQFSWEKTARMTLDVYNESR